MVTDDQEKKKRETSASIAEAREARTAIADIIAACGPLRDRLAMITFKAQRRLNEAERAHLLEECAEIQTAVQESRTALLLALMDASRAVLSNSRVADVEKALDNLEAGLVTAQASLRKP